MRRMSSFGWLSGVLFFFYGCASVQISQQIQAGRLALLINRPEEALPHFQQAVQMDPNFIMDFGVYREGAWTYVGRAQYLTGKLPEARQSLERALALDPNDNLAKLYLGLTLARSGDHTAGLRQIESGMTGLYDWLEYVARNTRYGKFWDPLREIRNEIQKNLNMLSSERIDWEQLISGGEWVGYKMEDEINRARDDERRSLDRNGFRFGVMF